MFVAYLDTIDDVVSMIEERRRIFLLYSIPRFFGNMT